MGQVRQILVDSDVLIELTNKNKLRHKEAFESISAIEEEEIIILYSLITRIELIQGQKTEQEKDIIRKAISRFEVVYLNDTICLKAVELIDMYSASHNLLLADALIAATATVLDIELFTYNTKDYRFIKGLKLYLPSN